MKPSFEMSGFNWFWSSPNNESLDPNESDARKFEALGARFTSQVAEVDSKFMLPADKSKLKHKTLFGDVLLWMR